MPSKAEIAENLVKDLLNNASQTGDQSKYQQVIRICDQILSEDSKCNWAWTYKGIALKDLNKEQDAASCFEKSLSIDPNNKVAWYNKGLCLHFTDYKKAIECYDQALRLDKMDKKALFMKGVALRYDEHKREAAIECFDRVLSIDPENADALSKKASTLLWLRRYEEAVQCYDLLFAIDPQDETYLNKVDALLKLKQPEEAVAIIDQLLDCKPDDSHLWHYRARILSYHLGRFEIANNAFQRAQILIEKKQVINSKMYSTENIIIIQILRGRFLIALMLENYEQANSYCDQALRLITILEEVSDLEICLLLDKAKVLSYLERYSEALNCYEKASVVAVRDKYSQSYFDEKIDSHKGLLLLLQNKSTTVEVENLFNGSLRFNSSNYIALLGKACVAFLQERNDIAQQFFDQAEKYATTGDNIELIDKLGYFDLLGRMCFSLNCPEQARNAYQKALTLHPHFLPALSALKKIPIQVEKIGNKIAPSLVVKDDGEIITHDRPPSMAKLITRCWEQQPPMDKVVKTLLDGQSEENSSNNANNVMNNQSAKP